MRYITATVIFSAFIMFFLSTSTGYTTVITEDQYPIQKEQSLDLEAVVFQLDEITFKFQLANKISKEDISFYQKRLNHGVKFAQSIELTKKSCKIVFKSGLTEDEIHQGLTFATKTFRYKTFKITTHE